MLGIILVAISIYLDGFLSLYMPYLPGEISLLNPMLTIVSLILIYPLYRKKEKTYFILICIAGIYRMEKGAKLLEWVTAEDGEKNSKNDLKSYYKEMIVNLLFGLIIKKIYKELDVRHIKLSLHIILLIVLYELIMALFILIFNLVPITLPKLIYKITHSILLNIIYGEALYELIKRLPYKFKRIDIN